MLVLGGDLPSHNPERESAKGQIDPIYVLIPALYFLPEKKLAADSDERMISRFAP